MYKYSSQGRVSIRRRPEDGKPGVSGLSILREDWSINRPYRNDTTSGEEIRYLYWVHISGTPADEWYVCKEAHNGLLSSESNKPGTSGGEDYWEKADSSGAIYTPTLFANTISADWIDTGTLSGSDVKSKDGGWWLRQGGSGYLAGGNVYWEGNGGLTIDSGSTYSVVTSVGVLDSKVFKLSIHRHTETDVLPFKVGDIVVQELEGGASSWARVVLIDQLGFNLTVTLYDNEDVPGGINFTPLPGRGLYRHGNAIIGEDSETRMIFSSTGESIRFLKDISHPGIADHNISLSIGKLPFVDKLDEKGIPVKEGDVGIVAQTIIAENFYQFDYNGDIKTNVVDRGEWSLSVAQGESPYRNVQHEAVYPDGKTTYTLLEQHTVYHLGCKWGCLVDKTILAPAVFSPAWQMLEGDSNYSVQFISSTGSFAFRNNNINADITARIFYGNIDVTEEVMSMVGVEIEWLRDTGNIPSDNSWKPSYGDSKNVLQLRTSDLGSGWCISYWGAKFTFIVHIPVGDGYEQITDFIGFNI